ncbi:hypothetical protein L873DRAFT_1814840 [Choiromyces venosus 120613-1]|uniref:Mitochondrial intermembrane space import and assembly protein 40 n=1 Tax=Choiromyces venosus 120613-1 TaxID=1336337 RepID=A0A3N4JJS4_9PEZI|nr:hypothetical protein L873DRAFT_1814840 [Choiromyces venosus 120613-1]
MSILRPVRRSLLGRQILLTPVRSTIPAPLLRNTGNTRSLFTAAPKQKRSSFKSFVPRWAVAGGLIYAYTTSNVFADEPKFLQDEPETISPEDQDRPKSLLPEKGGKLGKPQRSDAEDDRLLTTDEGRKGAEKRAIESAGSTPGSGSPEDLEAEAGQEGAFNPETGEINWDCPCLGGMAHGPCGEEFKTAFSCFVFSNKDPKGVDCIEKFKDMQTCFQKYPEIYSTEDEDEDHEELAEGGSEKEPLEVLDPKHPEETRSPATSKVASSTHVDPEIAKPDTEPVGAKSKEDAITATKEGVNSEK